MNKRQWLHGRTAVVGAAILLTAAGCAVVGAAGDVAGGAIDTTGTLLHAGKFSTFSGVTRAQATDAARDVVEALGLHRVKTYIHPDQQTLVYVDDRKQEVWITLVSRTPRVTEVRVDVGLFGTEGLGKLVMVKIVERLTPPGSATRPSEAAATMDGA